jgi:hypothetical protein
MSQLVVNRILIECKHTSVEKDYRTDEPSKSFTLNDIQSPSVNTTSLPAFLNLFLPLLASFLIILLLLDVFEADLDANHLPHGSLFVILLLSGLFQDVSEVCRILLLASFGLR